MISRYRIAIPTFDNPGTVVEVARGCLSETTFPILIVDDGSSSPVEAALAAEAELARAREAGRLRVIRFAENRGKGVALQEAFRDSVREGFTHLIAIDGDGQHYPREIAKLVALSRVHPNALVIGDRRLEADTVPGASRFGRRFSNFWVRFQTDIRVADSQSGFRVYPLFWLQNMGFFTRRFDFEIEVMIRLLWRGVEIREAPVDVYYPKREERVSHFDKLWDNVRISLLNTALVAVSLLRKPKSPVTVAFAIGVGVWVGCTPFLGLHSLIAAAIALIFRLNFVYLWLGTQVSFPLIAPFLVVASVKLGAWMTGHASEGASAFSRNWLVGSFALGAALGTLIGLVSYRAARAMRAHSSGHGSAGNWNGRARGGRLGNGFLKLVLKHCGLRPAYFCLTLIVPYFYLFAPRARRAADEYWRVIAPELSFSARQSRVLRQLRQFARILLDRVYQSFHDAPVFAFNRNGIENILEPIEAREGLLMLSAHVGAWDLAAAALKPDGMAGEFHMVRFEAAGLTMEQVKESSHADHLRGLAVNAGGQPILAIRQVLAEGRPVGLMGDRPMGRHYELVPFFGKLAPFDVTPFRIAAACGARLLFTFGFKGEENRYDLYATESRRYAYDPAMGRAEQCRLWAAEFAQALEQMLRRYPEQWANFYPFWSSLPAPPEVSSAKTASSILEGASRRPQASGAPLASSWPS